MVSGTPSRHKNTCASQYYQVPFTDLEGEWVRAYHGTYFYVLWNILISGCLGSGLRGEGGDTHMVVAAPCRAAARAQRRSPGPASASDSGGAAAGSEGPLTSESSRCTATGVPTAVPTPAGRTTPAAESPKGCPLLATTGHNSREAAAPPLPPRRGGVARADPESPAGVLGPWSPPAGPKAATGSLRCALDVFARRLDAGRCLDARHAHAE